MKNIIVSFIIVICITIIGTVWLIIASYFEYSFGKERRKNMKNKKKDNDNKVVMTIPALYKMHGYDSGIYCDIDCIVRDHRIDKSLTISAPNGTFTITLSALENLINAVK